jgi:putative membrane protein
MKAWQKSIIYRHIGWVYDLRAHLLKQSLPPDNLMWFSDLDQEILFHKSNVPAQILNLQGLEIKKGFKEKWIEDFRQYELIHTIESLYDCQGKCERIKNTVFPFYYNYFTQVFLWLFIICLPFSLVGLMGWLSVPMSIAISFVFTILEKSGILTEEPFNGIAADTPMKTLARNIEIDLREMIGDKDIPDPEPIIEGHFGVQYIE